MTDSLEEFDYTAATYYNSNSSGTNRVVSGGPAGSSGTAAGLLTSPQSTPNSLYNLPYSTFSPPSSSSSGNTATTSSGIIHGNASVYRSRYTSNSLDYTERGDYYNNATDSTPITLGDTAEVDHQDDQDSEEEVFQLINISIYDAMTPSSTILRVNRRIYAKEICRAIGNKLELSKEEAQYHTLVLVVTTYDHEKRMNVHCVRTFQAEELVLNIVDSLLAKLIDKYQVVDVTKLRNSVRWYYKDVRTTPIEFGDNEEATGEYSSDEEEEVSHSDLAYLAKAERKGYLLKRSGRDQNLWRKWYCVLTDHLWCIDIHRTVPKAICVRLSGMIRSSHLHNKTASSYNNRRMVSRDISPASGAYAATSGKERYSSGAGESQSSAMSSSEEQQLHNIVINSTRGTHLLRAFNLQDQKKWIEELHLKTTFALENDYFNMAEVIVCDEEVTKSRRFHRPITSLLGIPMFYDSLAQDQRKLQYTHVSIPMEDVEEEEDVGDTGMVSAGSESNTSSRRNNEDDEADGLLSLSPSSSSLSVSPMRSRASNSVASSVVNSPFTPASIAATNHTGINNNHSTQQLLTTTKVHFSTIHPLDRTLQTSSIHRIYGHDALFTHVLRLFLDILEYKELFRHDLFITSSYQRQVAVFIFLKYLMPILQIQDTQNVGERTLDGRLISSAVKSMSFKALLLNYDENELLAFLSLAQASAQTQTQTQIRSSTSSSQKLVIDTDATVSASSATTTLKPLMKPEEANNSLHRINSSGSVSTPKSRLDMLWALSNVKLFKVYSALFESEVSSGKSPNGTSSADRLKAGTGQTSLGEQNKAANLANNANNSASFWSWGWSSANTPSSGGNGAGSSSKQLPVSSQQPTAAHNEENVAMVNFPTQDLFDGILEEVQLILVNQ